MLPLLIKSSILGTLELRESTSTSGKTVFHDCAYEGRKAEHGRQVRVVLNPDFEWPYPEDAVQRVHLILSKAEELHFRLHELGTEGIFELHRSGISELGEIYRYEDWGATEEDLFANWQLESEIYFDDGFRLIYANHPIYYLDLLHEFDAEMSPTTVQFDG